MQFLVLKRMKKVLQDTQILGWMVAFFALLSLLQEFLKDELEVSKFLLFTSGLSFSLAFMCHVRWFASRKLILNCMSLVLFIILIKINTLWLLEQSFYLNLLPFHLFINNNFFSVPVRLFSLWLVLHIQKSDYGIIQDWFLHCLIPVLVELIKFRDERGCQQVCMLQFS